MKSRNFNCYDQIYEIWRRSFVVNDEEVNEATFGNAHGISVRFRNFDSTPGFDGLCRPRHW